MYDIPKFKKRFKTNKKSRLKRVKKLTSNFLFSTRRIIPSKLISLLDLNLPWIFPKKKERLKRSSGNIYEKQVFIPFKRNTLYHSPQQNKVLRVQITRHLPITVRTVRTVGKMRGRRTITLIKSAGRTRGSSRRRRSRCRRTSCRGRSGCCSSTRRARKAPG